MVELTSLAMLMDELEMQDTSPSVSSESLGRLASLPRVELLEHLRTKCGLALKERQRLANGLGRARREGRLPAEATGDDSELGDRLVASWSAGQSGGSELLWGGESARLPGTGWEDESRDSLLRRYTSFVSRHAWRQVRAVDRVWATSDLHVEHKENMAFLRALEPRPADALVVAGDVCSKLELLLETLLLLRTKFAEVVYCVGNHELWSAPQGQHAFDKLLTILEEAQRIGVHVTPTLFGDAAADGRSGGGGGGEGGDGGGCGLGLAVFPLQSWHQPGWLRGEAEAELSLPAAAMDAMCRWPRCLAGGRKNGSVSPLMAPFFAELNAPLLAEPGLSRRLQGRDVVSISHFLPERRLHMGFRWLGDVEGSDPLAEQVAALRPAVHVFGHTHWSIDMTIGRTRYVQQPLGYPRERRDEGYRLRTCAADPLALVWDAAWAERRSAV